jgi:hypothetical protein
MKEAQEREMREPLPDPVSVHDLHVAYPEAVTVLLTGLTPAGTAWLEQEFGDRDDVQWYDGASLIVEPKDLPSVLDGAFDAGLTVTAQAKFK